MCGLLLERESTHTSASLHHPEPRTHHAHITYAHSADPQISTLGVDHDLLAAGGFTGELVVAKLRGAPPPPDEDGCAPGYAAGYAPTAAEEEEDESSEDEAAAAAARHGWRGGGYAGGMACGFGRVGRHCRLVYSGRITQCENGITNGIEISRSGERAGRFDLPSC